MGRSLTPTQRHRGRDVTPSGSSSPEFRYPSFCEYLWIVASLFGVRDLGWCPREQAARELLATSQTDVVFVYRPLRTNSTDAATSAT